MGIIGHVVEVVGAVVRIVRLVGCAGIRGGRARAVRSVDRMGIILKRGRDIVILGRLPIREDDHEAFAARNVLGPRHPIRLPEIVWVPVRDVVRVVGARVGGWDLGIIAGGLIERLGQRGPGAGGGTLDGRELVLDVRPHIAQDLAAIPAPLELHDTEPSLGSDLLDNPAGIFEKVDADLPFGLGIGASVAAVRAGRLGTIIIHAEGPLERPDASHQVEIDI